MHEGNGSGWNSSSFRRKELTDAQILYHKLKGGVLAENCDHQHKIKNPSTTSAANCPSAVSVMSLGVSRSLILHLCLASVSRSLMPADQQLHCAQGYPVSLCRTVQDAWAHYSS